MSLADGGDDKTFVRDRSDPRLQDSPGPIDASHRLSGLQLGRYVVLERIASGGMGEVFAAWDPQLDRKVAHKLVRADVVQQLGSSQGRSRLLREAQAMAKLSHPNIVTVHDAGTVGDEVFVAMEFLDGQSLKDWLASEQLPWRARLRVFLEAGKGLAAAHEAGLVHRDFKPHNVIVTRSGRVCVLDFGLARAANAQVEPATPPQAPLASNSISVDSTLTAAGALMGTPGYMSPEQYKGHGTDARTDQFSFCVALYEALYGEKPFRGETLEALRSAAEAGVPREPRKGAPKALYRIIARGMAPKADDRFPSMAELLRALNRVFVFRTGRTGYVWAVAALSVCAFATAWLARGALTNPCPSAEPRWKQVWSRSAKGEVEQAFNQSGLPFAKTAFTEVDRLLNAYGHEWVAMHAEACAATNVRHEQSTQVLDLRMECLNQKLSEATALVGVLRFPDARVVTNAVTAASALKPVQSCENVKQLFGRASNPPVAIQSKVAALQEKLSQAEVHIGTGREEEAQKELLAIATEVDDTGWEPLKGEYALTGATLYENRGQAKEFRERIHAAVASAIRSGNDEQLLRAWTKIARFESSTHNLNDARVWIAYAEAQLPKVGDSPLLAGDVENAAYYYALYSGDYSTALTHILAAKANYERVFGPDHPRLAIVWDEIGWTQSWMGDQDAAIASERKAEQMLEQKLGTEHPALGRVLNHVAAIEEERDELDAALTHHLRALALREKLYGNDHAEIAASLNNLALVYVRLGRSEEATKAAERAVAIERKINAESGRLAATLDTLGRALLAEHRYAEAVKVFEEALELFKRNSGEDRQDFAIFYWGLGEAQLGMGDTQKAIATLELALSGYTDQSLSSYVGGTKSALAQAYLKAGQVDRARKMADGARAEFAKSGKKGETMRAVLDAAFAAAGQ